MFDRDDSGTVDSNEFESFMEVLREETNVGRAEVSYSHKAYYAGEKGEQWRKRKIALSGVNALRKETSFGPCVHPARPSFSSILLPGCIFVKKTAEPLSARSLFIVEVSAAARLPFNLFLRRV